MPIDVVMPKLGLTMASGTIGRRRGCAMAATVLDQSEIDERLKLVAKQVLQYRHMYRVDPGVEQVAIKLVGDLRSDTQVAQPVS